MLMLEHASSEITTKHPCGTHLNLGLEFRYPSKRRRPRVISVSCKALQEILTHSKGFNWKEFNKGAIYRDVGRMQRVYKRWWASRDLQIWKVITTFRLEGEMEREQDAWSQRELQPRKIPFLQFPPKWQPDWNGPERGGGALIIRSAVLASWTIEQHRGKSGRVWGCPPDGLYTKPEVSCSR